MPEKRIIFVMGVSGSGKSTIGKMLAATLSSPFFDGDDFHPKENIEKMASGEPLNDDDRFGWLKSLNQLAKEHTRDGAVIACSALKEKYRALLSDSIAEKVAFVYLRGSFEEIKARMQQREGHFMAADMLQSQFDTLEPPSGAITVSISETPKQMVQTILNHLN
ncbi:gluconokinase [Allomuricauda sp. d1]|uniref:gluconokinase n=1 Tax=Allomuricauda sp. d1 TaxID=3136725 RepID=UPI0031DBB890